MSVTHVYTLLPDGMSNSSTFVSTHCWANNVCQFDLSLTHNNMASCLSRRLTKIGKSCMCLALFAGFLSLRDFRLWLKKFNRLLSQGLWSVDQGLETNLTSKPSKRYHFRHFTTPTKVVPFIKGTCTVFIDNVRNISTNLSI